MRPANRSQLTALAAILLSHAQMGAADTPLPEKPNLNQQMESAIHQMLATQPLWLEVSINGQSGSKLLEVQMAGGSEQISVALSNWQAFGLVATPAELDSKDRVQLSLLSDVKAEYDAANQRLKLTVPASRFKENVVNATGRAGHLPDATPLNATVNYDFFLQHARPEVGDSSTGFAGRIEGRLAGDWGNLEQSVIARASLSAMGGGNSVYRLDTSYRHYDPIDMTNWQLGDAVSAGLTTRPAVRFAGIQWRRNFSLRPDLITFPMPSISGSSAVPSSVDVYVNQVRRSQADVPPGPFTLNQLPVLTGPNQVQVVVRDALGREQLTTMDLFTSPQMLQPGLLDFAVQAGFRRRNYASDYDHYDDDPLTIAAARYGLSNDFTIEGQGEYARGLGLLSGGLAGLIGTSGSYGIDIAGSQHRDGFGAEVNGRFNYYFTRQSILNGSFSESTQRFRDIASADSGFGMVSSRQQLSFNQGLGRGTVGLNWTRQRSRDDSRFSSIMLTGGANIASRGYLSLSGWQSIEGNENWGVNVGLSWSLGDRENVNAYYTTNDRGSTGVVSAQSSLSLEPGWGWRVNAAEGQQSYQRAELLNRNRISDVNALFENNAAGQFGRFGATGALAWMPGSLQAGRRITDSYALVDIGYPNVAVFQENRPVGRTDDDGYLMVNNLRAYQQNKLRIDPLDLPLDVSLSDPERLVVPARESGVRVNFDLERNREGLLALKNQNGQWLPLGSRLVLPSGEQRVIGHDGQVLVSADLAGQTLEILSEAYRCALSLPKTIQPDQQHTLTLETICR